MIFADYRIKDIIGQRFGKLIVVSYDSVIKGTGALWLCKCDCGGQVVVRGGSLKSGNTKSCGCYRNIPHKYVSRREFLVVCAYNDMIRRQKKKYKVETDIDIVAFEKLIMMDCFYCGSKPSNVKRDIWHGHKTSDEVLYYNGLDREINRRGYFLDNVVPCCGKCNIAKGTQDLEEFQEHVEKIYNNFVRYKSENISG